MTVIGCEALLQTTLRWSVESSGFSSKFWELLQVRRPHAFGYLTENPVPEYVLKLPLTTGAPFGEVELGTLVEGIGKGLEVIIF